MSSSSTRRRNAAATREDILTSARQAFVRSGYDGAGVREIAQGAGVTAMMVNRYFGSKEQLFAEVVALTMADPVILAPGNTANRSRMAEAFADALLAVTSPGATSLDGFTIMLRSASSERAAQIARGQIELHHQRTMSRALGGDLADERAGIMLALVAGFQVMRQMIGTTALAGASPVDLKKVLVPVIEALIGAR